MKKQNEVIKMLFLISQIGITMLTTIFLCTGVGYLLDKMFNTKWIIIVFIVLGILAGYKSVYILIKRFINDDKKEDGNGQ